MRIPERLDSMSALMEAVTRFTAREVSRIRLRFRVATARKMGISTSISRARRHWMVNRMAMAPTTVTVEMNTSSGP